MAIGRRSATRPRASAQSIRPTANCIRLLSTGLTQTRFLDSRAIKRELAGPAFDFRALKQRPISVWLILPANRLATHAKWLRLTLTTIIQQLMQDTTKAKVPVAII